MNSCRFSSDANADVEEIAFYIFDLNPVAASRFLDALDETCALLAQHPLIGRARPELGDNLRSYAVGNFTADATCLAHWVADPRGVFSMLKTPVGLHDFKTVSRWRSGVGFLNVISCSTNSCPPRR